DEGAELPEGDLMHAHVVGPADPDAVPRLLVLLGQVVALRGPHEKLARRDQGQGHAERVADPAGVSGALLRLAFRRGRPGRISGRLIAARAPEQEAQAG